MDFQLVAIDEGAAVPRDPRHFSGIAVMGGAMSVNDDLPWIAPLAELARNAVRNDIPLLSRVDHPVAVNPDPVLAELASERGWPVITIR